MSRTNRISREKWTKQQEMYVEHVAVYEIWKFGEMKYDSKVYCMYSIEKWRDQ
jgi:hypothetical protein